MQNSTDSNMNTKPTPGPWKFQQTTIRIHGSEMPVVAVYGTGEDCLEKVVAFATGSHGGSDGKQRPTDEAFENARLIASAPDMLDALKAIVAALEQPCQSTIVTDYDKSKLAVFIYCWCCGDDMA